MFEGWILTWILTDVKASNDDGSRLSVYDADDYHKAVAHGNHISQFKNVTKVRLNRLSHGNCSVDDYCPICFDINTLDGPY